MSTTWIELAPRVRAENTPRVGLMPINSRQIPGEESRGIVEASRGVKWHLPPSAYARIYG